MRLLGDDVVDITDGRFRRAAMGAPMGVDPDCRAGKHASCVGGGCPCECHRTAGGRLADPFGPAAPARSVIYRLAVGVRLDGVGLRVSLTLKGRSSGPAGVLP